MLEFRDSNQLLNMNLVQNVRLELFELFFFNLIIPSAKQGKKQQQQPNKQFYLKE